MTLKERLDADLKNAMRSGATIHRDTIRLLMSALRNAEIDNHGPLDEAGTSRVVAKEVKQRRDSIEEYKKGNRQDLVDREQAELDVLAQYQPDQLSPEQVREIVMAVVRRIDAKGPSDLGKVMREAMADVQGRADGGVVSTLARELLMHLGSRTGS